MTDEELQAEIRRGIQAMIAAMGEARRQLDAARFLSSMAFLAMASEVKDGLIVATRALFPDETYEETGARLGVHPSTVNKAVVRHNQRQAES